jgi:hypothetical protein
MSIRSLFQRSRGRRGRSRSARILARDVRPMVDGLENRQLMTVRFIPAPVDRPAVVNAGGPTLIAPSVYAIYWGNSFQYPDYLVTINNALTKLCPSQYTDPLAKYASIGAPIVGAPSFAGGYISSLPVLASADANDIQDVINDAVAQHGVPDTDHAPSTPIYLVFTDAYIPIAWETYYMLGELYTGTRGIGELHGAAGSGSYNFGWIQNVGTDEDLTSRISRVLVDTISSADPDHPGLVAIPPAGAGFVPDYTGIADYDATLYQAKIGGVLVQSYWSQADNAYVIGGGDQNFDINVQDGVLTINGDQGGTRNDTIQVGFDDNLDLRISENGTTAEIPVVSLRLDRRQVISKVVVRSKGGQDKVTVNGSIDGCPIEIQPGAANVAVTVTSPNKNLYDLFGDVTVDASTGAGKCTLNIDDSGCPTLETYSISDSSFSRYNTSPADTFWIYVNNPAGITLEGCISGAMYNAKIDRLHACPLSITGGVGNDVVNASRMFSAFSFDGGKGVNTVNLGAALSSSDIYAGVLNYNDTVSLASTGGNLIVNADDSKATVAFPTMFMNTPNKPGSGRIHGLVPADIDYQYTPNGKVSLLVSPTSNTTQYSIVATGEPTILDLGGNASAINLGLGSTANLVGDLKLHHTPGTLTVADYADPVARTINVDRAANSGPLAATGLITGFSPGRISYDFTDPAALHLLTGSAFDTVNVRSLYVPASVDETVAASVTVGGVDGLIDIQNTLKINSPALSTLTLDDSADSVPRLVSIDAVPGASTPTATIGGMTGGPITIAGKFSNLSLTTGQGSDTVNIHTLPFSLLISSAGGNDVVNVGQRGLTAGVTGNLVVSAQNGKTALTYDDSANPNSHNVQFSQLSSSGGLATGLAPGYVAYAYACLSGFNAKLGRGSDHVQVQATGAPTSINTGTGQDTIDVAPSSLNLASIAGSLTIASAGGGRLIFNDQLNPVATTYKLDPTGLHRSGVPDVLFSGQSAVNLWTGSAADAIAVPATTAGVYTSIFGGAGANTLSLGSNGSLDSILGGVLASVGVNGSTVADDSAATSSRKYTITSGLIQGAAWAPITFGNSKSFKLTAGNGGDTFDVGAAPSSTAVTLQGGTGPNTLLGPLTGATFSLTGPNAGGVGTSKLTFSGVGGLTGRGPNNAFSFAPSGSLSGKLIGGTGVNTLDYSAWKAPVSVNLQTNLATATAGIANIQNVLGGLGNDSLAGDSASNILVGNAGNDTLDSGNGGKDLLIGGAGADRIYDYFTDDVIVAGSTKYDAHVDALASILAEWARTDIGYPAKVADLKNGGGLNGQVVLSGAAVIDDNAIDTILSPGGFNWYVGIGTKDQIPNKKSGEQVN